MFCFPLSNDGVDGEVEVIDGEVGLIDGEVEVKGPAMFGDDESETVGDGDDEGDPAGEDDGVGAGVPDGGATGVARAVGVPDVVGLVVDAG